MLRTRPSNDAILLMFIKLVTSVLGLATTRLLSEHLTVYDYGTYSQVMLIVSVVTSATILGMMDGVNFFYCTQQDVRKRETYISTLFALQCIISAAGGCLVLALSVPLCAYFENPDIQSVLIFAACLPMLQNLLSMIQILIVSAGEAKLLALRNIVVSVARLLVVIFIVAVARNIVAVLATTVILDVLQIIVFSAVLQRKQCGVSLKSVRKQLAGEILRYCAPMAVFVILNSLNRDIDKYLVAAWTDTETLAVYTNASKVLPFDIVISSFTTVLLPHLTKAIVSENYDRAAALYRDFLEIAYISTTVLCCAALAASPQLMKLLYSNKYMDGLHVFCIYILVDMLRFTNITMVLTAAGKTQKLMFFSVGSLILNLVLNVALYHLMGITGPAVATLIATSLLGVAILTAGARELRSGICCLFDWKYLIRFAAENVLLMLLLYRAQLWLEKKDVHYFLILVIICGCYGLTMLAMHGKRLLKAINSVNRYTEA